MPRRLALFPSPEPPKPWWRRATEHIMSSLMSIYRFLVSGRVAVMGLSIGIVTVGIWVSITHWSELSSNGESTSATIRNVALVLGGIVALVLSIWRSYIADRQAYTARRQSEIAQRRLLDERYQKGLEMLGSDVLSVRLGGIYALDRLAKEQPSEYHIPIIKQFCAFVRNPTGKPTEVELRQQCKKPTAPPLRVDIQEVVTAIGRRSEDGIKEEDTAEGFELDLSGADLRGLRLPDGNLRGVDLHGSYLMHAYLANVDLRGARCAFARLFMAQLLFCDLTDVDFSWSDLSGSNLFTSVLKNAKLTRTEISTGLERRTTDGQDYVSSFAQLTQKQLDAASAEENWPPVIAPGTKDRDTGEPLVWRRGPAGDRE